MEDGRIDENMLALSIGLTTTGVYGLARAVNSEQWYRNIILHDSLYSCEQLLEFIQSLQNKIPGNCRCGIIFQNLI